MHLEKPLLAKYLGGSDPRGYTVLQKIFFAPTASSQTAGDAFIAARAAARRPGTCSGHGGRSGAVGSVPRLGASTGERFAALKKSIIQRSS